MSSPPLIELRDVARSFGQVQALRGLTGEIRGTIIGLLGPNGAGKSTLLKGLLGLLAHEGQARVLGLDTKLEGAAIRDRVGYMPEQDVLLPGHTAVELCTYAAELSGLPRLEAISRAHAALYYAGLDEKRYQPVDGYSTGQKQRVKLAQALVHDPELLFLDEPTNGLDPTARAEMIALIAELPAKRGCAVVLSTHLLGDIERLCDHAVIMHEGRLRFVGTVDELRQRRGADAAFVLETRDEASVVSEALSARGAEVTRHPTSQTTLTCTLPAHVTVPELFALVQGLGNQVRGLEVSQDSMEAAFLRVIETTHAKATRP